MERLRHRVTLLNTLMTPTVSGKLNQDIRTGWVEQAHLFSIADWDIVLTKLVIQDTELFELLTCQMLCHYHAVTI